jgi:hypothetical protein
MNFRIYLTETSASGLIRFGEKMRAAYKEVKKTELLDKRIGQWLILTEKLMLAML